MSEGTRIPLAEARALADELLALLGPYCERLEVVGSIRRQRETIGDIELLAVPKQTEVMAMDLFGERPDEALTIDALHDRCNALFVGNVLTMRLDKNGRQAFGHKYKRLRYRDVGLDLFAVLKPMCHKCGIILPIRIDRPGVVGAEQEDAQDLPAVQSGISNQGRDVLQPGLWNQGTLRQHREKDKQALPGNMRNVQGALPENILESARRDVRSDLCREITSGSQDASMERRATPSELEGDRPEGSLSSSVRSEGPSLPGSEGLRSTAPLSDGTTHRPISRALREGSSPERGQDRQSHRQSGDRDARSPERRSDLPTLPQELPGPLATLSSQCPKCGGRNIRAPQWGVLSVIRTGSAEFSHRLVTPIEAGGWMPRDMYCRDGSLWTTQGDPILTPQEVHVFDALGRPYVPPELREVLP